jgi:hypothetical protein
LVALDLNSAGCRHIIFKVRVAELMRDDHGLFAFRYAGAAQTAADRILQFCYEPGDDYYSIGERA